MGKYVYLDEETERHLDNEAPKSESGVREESYSTQLKRLLKINGGK